MELPFTQAEFFAVFAAYNDAIWPVQIAAYALGLAAIGGFWLNHVPRRRLLFLVLAAFWAWNGGVYHYLYFSPVNPAAVGFAALFVLQAVLLAVAAFAPQDIRLTLRRDVRTALAFALMAYATVVYELLGFLAGHGGAEGPLFGVAPCPTTIFTIGMLMLIRGRHAAWLSAIPLIWAAVGTSAAVMLGVPEDLGLAAAALCLVGTWCLSPAAARPT